MEKLPELKAKLSAEKRKPKNERNKALMIDLQDQISQHNTALKIQFMNRRMEKQKDEVNLNLSLWKKKNEMYAKIREANKKEKLASEKQKVDKLQQKKKAK